MQVSQGSRVNAWEATKEEFVSQQQTPARNVTSVLSTSCGEDSELSEHEQIGEDVEFTQNLLSVKNTFLHFRERPDHRGTPMVSEPLGRQHRGGHMSVPLSKLAWTGQLPTPPTDKLRQQPMFINPSARGSATLDQYSRKNTISESEMASSEGSYTIPNMNSTSLTELTSSYYFAGRSGLLDDVNDVDPYLSSTTSALRMHPRYASSIASSQPLVRGSMPLSEMSRRSTVERDEDMLMMMDDRWKYQTMEAKWADAKATTQSWNLNVSRELARMRAIVEESREDECRMDAPATRLQHRHMPDAPAPASALRKIQNDLKAAIATEPMSEMRDLPKEASKNRAAARSNRKNNKQTEKFLCTFFVNIQNDRQFLVTRKIIGPNGSHMKNISALCPNTKLRLRGKGSGYRDSQDKTESNVPLQINVSCTSNLAEYEAGKAEVARLLNSIYEEYKEFTGGKVVQYKLHEKKKGSTKNGK